MANKNKLELELLVLCDYASVSKDNKLTIAGIFDQVFVNKTPAQHPKLFVVGIVHGEAESEHKISLQIKDPAGKEVFPKQELAVKLGVNGKTNLIAEVGNLPISTTGRYVVELGVEGKTFGKKELSVFAAKSPSPTKSASKYTN